MRARTALQREKKVVEYANENATTAAAGVEAEVATVGGRMRLS